MRIAINAQLLDDKKVGIGNYIYQLIKNLPLVDKKNQYVIFRREARRGFPFGRILWEQLIMPWTIKRAHADIFHSPDYSLPIFGVSCRKIITVHDLSVLKYPKTFPFLTGIYKRMMLKFSLRKADKIIAVSQSTKKDIGDLFKIPPEKIKVIYHGVDKIFKKVGNEAELREAKKKHRTGEKFILYVGTLEPRKNISRLVEAYQQLRQKGFKHKLVIVGKKGRLFKDIFKVVKQLNLEKEVIFTGYVPEKELVLLYSAADLFVYPSLYEGFGLPVLEAMACGVPVITSNVSSLPEVVGEAAIMVDPYNIRSLSEKMARVLSDKNLREELAKKGLERIKNFSWEKCGRETLAIYKETYAEGRASKR